MTTRHLGRFGVLATTLALCVASFAAVAVADTTVEGPNGQRLTAAKSTGVNPAGEKITVSGTGYNVNKGIYVAFCVDNGPGQVPTPCVGGIDMGGGSGSSFWISSNPPPYGVGLAIPYGAGGTFRVELSVAAKDEFTDCTVKSCAVVTRSDHTNAADRSQDVRVPVTFAAPSPSTSPSASISPSASATPSASVSPTASPSASTSPTASPTPTPTLTTSPSASATPSPSATVSPSTGPVPTVGPVPTAPGGGANSLPTTGIGPVPALVAAGLGLALLGLVVLLAARRRRTA